MLQTVEPKKRRKHAPEETRAQLLRASAKCFAAVGYGRTQVSDVTREAGVAVGTFYVHFTDKEEALLTVLRNHFDPVRAGLQALRAQLKAERSRDPAGALREIQTYIVQHSLKDPDGFLAWFRHGHDVSESADRLVLGYQTHLEQALAEELAETAGLDDRTRSLLAQALVGMMLSLINRRLLTGEPSEADAIRISLLLTTGGLTAARAAAEPARLSKSARTVAA